MITEDVTLSSAEYPPGMDCTNSYWTLNYKASRPTCRALVASDGKHALLLDFIGPDMDILDELDSTHFHGEEWDGAPAGMWIWEGSVRFIDNLHGESDMEREGAYRALTEEEWTEYRLNDRPWNEADWGDPWPEEEST